MSGYDPDRDPGAGFRWYEYALAVPWVVWGIGVLIARNVAAALGWEYLMSRRSTHPKTRKEDR